MTEDPKTEPLLEWNRLARENTENAIVSSMFQAAAKAIEPLEKFSTWLLIGAAAIASFLITNSDKVLPLLGSKGFSACGAFLCASCIFGLLSKIYGLRAQIAVETGAAVQKTFEEHFEKYKEQEQKIKAGAKSWGIDIQTGIRLDRVLTEFFKPLPRWVVWMAMRHFKKHAGNPQIGNFVFIGLLNAQGYLAAGQGLAFLAFMVTGFFYGATN
jgi:hypothetical protein